MRTLSPVTRTVGGYVNLDGTIHVGVGFVTQRIGVGSYWVRFPSGSRLIGFACNIVGNWGYIETDSIGGDAVHISSTNTSGASFDQAFHFVATLLA